MEKLGEDFFKYSKEICYKFSDVENVMNYQQDIRTFKEYARGMMILRSCTFFHYDKEVFDYLLTHEIMYSL